MIKLQFDTKLINIFDKKIVDATKLMEILISPQSKSEIAKAIFTITGKKFIRDISNAAKSNKKKFHHLYEWGSTGIQKEKLFLIKRSRILYGDIIIEIVPLQSVKSVPIPQKLLDPGQTGKFVMSRKVFRNKAKVMEDGNPIQFTTKKTIVFLNDNDKMVFVPKKKNINILNPGGKSVKHALLEFSTLWYEKEAAGVVERSGIFNDIAIKSTRIMNVQSSNSAIAMKNMVREVSAKYSNEKVIL